MLIRLGYDIQFETAGEVPIVTLLNVHPSRKKDLREPDELQTDPLVKVESMRTPSAIRLAAWWLRRGKIRFQNSTLIEDSGEPDHRGPRRRRGSHRSTARECPALPYEQPLLRSRSPLEHCGRIILERSARMEAGSSRMRLGAQQGHVRIRVFQSRPHRAGGLYRARRSLPRLSASGHYLLPRP